MTADKVTEALSAIDDEALDCMVSDWVHCAVGHGNDAPFVAKYIRSHLAHRLQPVFEALAERAKMISVPLIPTDPEAERVVDRLVAQATAGNAERPLRAKVAPAIPSTWCESCRAYYERSQSLAAENAELRRRVEELESGRDDAVKAERPELAAHVRRMREALAKCRAALKAVGSCDTCGLGVEVPHQGRHRDCSYDPDSTPIDLDAMVQEAWEAADACLEGAPTEDNETKGPSK